MIPAAAREIVHEHFSDELGEVICRTKTGRTGDDQISSIGVAIQDAVRAALVVERARELGLGAEAPL